MPKSPRSANTAKTMVMQDIQRAMDRLSLLLENYIPQTKSYPLDNWDKRPKDVRREFLGGMSFICFQASNDLHLAYARVYPEDASPWLEDELDELKKWESPIDISSDLSLPITGLELANNILGDNSFVTAKAESIRGLREILGDVHKQLSSVTNVITANA